MTLDSLLLSQDSDLVRIVRPTLEKLSIDVEICHEARSAADILISEKFDAVIVDCDDLKGGLEVLQGLRSTPSNKNSVTFAILNGKKTTTQDAFGMGANFVLQKPISSLNASRCFHAALNFMIKERRRDDVKRGCAQGLNASPDIYTSRREPAYGRRGRGRVGRRKGPRRLPLSP